MYAYIHLNILNFFLAVVIPVPEEIVHEKLVQLLFKYNQTFASITKIIDDQVSVQELKQKVGWQYPDLEAVEDAPKGVWMNELLKP